MKAVLIRKSTREIIKIKKYPNADMSPVEGLDFDLEWLLFSYAPNPSYDPTTHKLVQLPGALTFTPHPDYPHLNIYEWVTIAVELNERELNENAAKSEAEDASSIAQFTYKEDGVKLFDRFFAKVIRQKSKGRITKNQVDKITDLLYPSLDPLYKGLWKTTKSRINDLNPPNNKKLLSLFNWIKDEVSNYITEKY